MKFSQIQIDFANSKIVRFQMARRVSKTLYMEELCKLCEKLGFKVHYVNRANTGKVSK